MLLFLFWFADHTSYHGLLRFVIRRYKREKMRKTESPIREKLARVFVHVYKCTHRNVNIYPRKEFLSWEANAWTCLFAIVGIQGGGPVSCSPPVSDSPNRFLLGSGLLDTCIGTEFFETCVFRQLCPDMAQRLIFCSVHRQHPIRSPVLPLSFFFVAWQSFSFQIVFTQHNGEFFVFLFASFHLDEKEENGLVLYPRFLSASVYVCTFFHLLTVL